ncbi:MAG: sulfatase [Bacillota bacterium]|nr:sulfatase [Bacillota bacterium]
MTKPNILILLSDQHRFCDLGCYGNKEVITPHFDAFAAQAVRFSQCISNSPLCVPARASLLTGLAPHKHRAITNDLPVDTSCASIATVLNRQGYQTGYIGKWHLGGIPRDKPIDTSCRLGFSEWKAANCHHQYHRGFYFDEENQRHEIEGYEPIAQTDLAIDFMSRNQEKDWCCVLSFGPPHDPYLDVPDRYLDLYRDCDLTFRGNVPDVILQRTGVELDRQQLLEFYRGYYAHITALDEQFGRIIASLKQSGQLDKTIIVYTSDHGDMLGSQGYLNKQLPFDEAIRVPLMIRYGNKTFCGVQNGLISLMDLPVSLLGLAGCAFDRPVDGHDLHNLFIDPLADGLKQAYILDSVPCHQSYQRGGTEWRGLRTERYTYARSADGAVCWLYNNIDDPLQQNDLSYRADLRTPLEESLQKLVAQHDEFLPWDSYIRKYGFRDEWNRSQTYFNLPIEV